MRDARGLLVTAASAEAVAALDHIIEGYLKYRADTSLRLKAALKLDPECGLLHVLKGSFAMLAYKRDFVPGAAAALAEAQRLTAKATAREQAHVAALAAWVAGDVPGALATWAQIVAEHPHDILAFRLHHFCAFWTGRADWMLDCVEAAMPRWGSDQPGFGSMLACRSFANEECGNYLVAEMAGREAIARDPGDLWAAHAVAHVLEMQGRRAEGIQWIAGLERHWEGGNNLMHHCWWHQAMYHLERGEFPAVLDLYDTRFRNLGSAVTQQQPDLYIDVQNAASMLFRLALHGEDVGDRWEELAEKAEARIGDTLSAFTLPHWMMALAATGRFEAARRMLEAMADGPTLVREVALPVCQGVLHFSRGENEDAVAAMWPVVGRMYELGGSHAQQDVLEQCFLHAALRCGRAGDVRLMLERVAGRHPVPPERRIGYAEAARSVSY